MPSSAVNVANASNNCKYVVGVWNSPPSASAFICKDKSKAATVNLRVTGEVASMDSSSAIIVTVLAPPASTRKVASPLSETFAEPPATCAEYKYEPPPPKADTVAATTTSPARKNETPADNPADNGSTAVNVNIKVPAGDSG